LSAGRSASRPPPDRLLVDIADYAAGGETGTPEARALARYCLFDALGCALLALDVPDCMRLIGPWVPGATFADGARVPGTAFALDPVKAAFDIACLIRWLDFNDSWATGGHPSDTIGSLLAVADYVARGRAASGEPPLLLRDLLTAIVKAYEIFGVISEGNSFDRPGIGLDSVIMVKIAATPVLTRLLGGTQAQIVNALSNVFADGQSLNLYRKVPNAGTRKSWAAADAGSRAVRFALMALQGEMGYPTALTAETWGFHAVLYRERPLTLPRPFGSRVVENIQFKISYPTQRHAQTAADAAVALHPLVADRFDDVDRIEIKTHALARKMISVQGPLSTVAARDHCLEYVVAVGLLHGTITGKSYEDDCSADPRIDALRARMTVEADERYTAGYEDPARRSNANAIQVFFRDGSATPKIEVEYPIGDPRRRAEGLPLVVKKFEAPLRARLPQHAAELLALFDDPARLEAMPVDAFMDRLTARA
jgi:2-methylcitrate dehydratase